MRHTRMRCLLCRFAWMHPLPLLTVAPRCPLCPDGKGRRVGRWMPTR